MLDKIGALKKASLLLKYGHVKSNEVTPELVAGFLSDLGVEVDQSNPAVKQISAMIKDGDSDSLASMLDKPIIVNKLATVFRDLTVGRAPVVKPALDFSFV